MSFDAGNEDLVTVIRHYLLLDFYVLPCRKSMLGQDGVIGFEKGFQAHMRRPKTLWVLFHPNDWNLQQFSRLDKRLGIMKQKFGVHYDICQFSLNINNEQLRLIRLKMRNHDL